MPSHRSDPALPGRAPVVLLALGLLSAAALLAASFTNFGDPRVEARAQARLSAATQIREIQVRWDELCRAEGPLPGTLETYRLDPAELDRADFTSATTGSDPRVIDPVLVALRASGRAALQRGELEAAFDAFEEALRQAKPGARDTERVMFEALRAAGAMGNTAAMERYRSQLLGADRDAWIEGTSARLLSMLVEPADPDAAFQKLMSGEPALPPPVDRAWMDGAAMAFTLDPWWKALESALEPRAPALDWKDAFQVELRKSMAVERLVGIDREAWLPHWTLIQRDDALFAARRRGEIGEIGELALVDEAILVAELSATDRDDIHVQIAASLDPELNPKSLAGSPLFVAAVPIDPEAAARPQLRRIRWIRGGLLGLSALVLLASFLSARAAARARRLAQLRSTFVASVSHDLRTPTQAILLLAEALEQDLVDSEAARGRYHTQIRREAQRLRRLVEDLLDGARIDRGGGARVERRLVRTEPFFGELTGAMQDRAAAAGADLRITVDSMPETIHVDPDGVHRAVWNLFENALRHGKPADGARAVVEVRIGCEDSVLRCVVTDDGPGIPARHAESVFAPFERLVDRAGKAGIDKDTGTGLGLSIVRAIAEGHGGAARVEPSPRGARFVVTFQAEETEGEAA